MKLPVAAVLAGGLGTRIRSVAGDTPKVLLPVGGRPFLAHLMEYIAGQGVEEVRLLLGHRHDTVLEAAEAAAPQGMRVTASVEDQPLGTGGAVRNALSELPDPFLLWNGDTWLALDLTELVAAHAAKGGWATLALTPTHNAPEKGSVEFDTVHQVVRFQEKATAETAWMNAGVYVLSKALFNRVNPGQAVSLERDILPRAVEEGRVYCVPQSGDFVDIGLPQDYESVRQGLPGGAGD